MLVGISFVALGVLGLVVTEWQMPGWFAWGFVVAGSITLALVFIERRSARRNLKFAKPSQ